MSLERQLAAERLGVATLENELAAAKGRVQALEWRIAVAKLGCDIADDLVVQEVATLLDGARRTFEASLVAPTDFNPTEDGDWEDTDDYGDASVFEKPVDVAIVKALGLIEESTNAAGIASGLRMLCCVTHFVARISENVDDTAKLAETCGDALEDLREDIEEAWAEVFDGLVHQSDDFFSEWIPAIRGLLAGECGGYYPEAAAAVTKLEKKPPIG